MSESIILIVGVLIAVLTLRQKNKLVCLQPGHYVLSVHVVPKSN